MAEVFVGELRGARGFRRTVVAKRLRPDFATRPRAFEMFEREASVLASLNHEHVVDVVDFVELLGEPWLLLEYVDGPSLRALLKANGALPLAAARRILGDVARALAAVHDAVDEGGRPLGLVHRDVSPDNIILSHTGQVKLLDFGIAKGQHHASLTTVGALKGKLAYMAPEQLDLAGADARVDLYALGVTAYECLAGRRPFEAKSDVLLMDLIVNSPPPELASLARLPASITLLVHWLLEKEPASRPTRAAEVAEFFDKRAHENAPIRALLSSATPSTRAAAMTATRASQTLSLASSVTSGRPADDQGRSGADDAQDGVESDGDNAIEQDDKAEATIRSARARLGAETSPSRGSPRPRSTLDSQGHGGPGWWSLVGGLVDDDVVELEEGSQVVRRLEPTPLPASGEPTVTVARPTPTAPRQQPAPVPPVTERKEGSRPRAAGVVVGVVVGVVGVAAIAVFAGDNSDGGIADAAAVDADDAVVDSIIGVDAGVFVATSATTPAASDVAPLPSPTPPVPLPSLAPAVDDARPQRTKRLGRLSVLAVPWAVVYLDGKRLGVTPIDEARVDAGKHRLRLVGPGGEVNRDVNISAGRSATVRVAMPGSGVP